MDNSSLPNDVVCGYTGSQLSGILNNSAYTLSALKTKVKASKPSGVTDYDIDTLFDVYESNWINDYN